MPRVAIIGGGVGGLATALRLRAGGAEVVLFEKNARLGGKLSSSESEGFYFDQGPTLLTMPFVLEQLFADMGARLEDYLELMPINPTCRYHWSDGTRFDAYSPASQFLEEVDRVFPGEREGVARYLADAERMYEATKELFLFGPFRRFSEFITHAEPALLRELPSLEPSRTLDGSVRRRINDPRLVQLFDRFATYSGSSPYRAPASLKVISHVELGIGAWYPRGGMISIVRALERLAVEKGVEIRTSTAVTSLQVQGRKVVGLRTALDTIAVDAVVGNVDVLWTYRNLLEPAGIPIPRSVRGAERSCSGFLMTARVRATHPELEHHNIFFADEYRSEFDDIFRRKRLPREMTIYISISAKTDRALAPPGCENWYMLVNAPADGLEHTDRNRQREFASRVWRRLELFGLRPERIDEQIIGPVDFETGTNSAGGALYGASSNSLLAPFKRPGNRVPGLDNMYFVGGSTHPGGGVPMVMLSGAIVAKMILEKHADGQG